MNNSTKVPTVQLKLKNVSLCLPAYEVVRLNNTASISIQPGHTASEQSARKKYQGKCWRVGDTMPVEVADFLCEDHRFDITITS